MKTFKTLVQKYFTGKTTLGEVLFQMTKMSPVDLEDAAVKGAVWLQKGKGKILKERSLKATVSPQDTVTFFYDPKVLSFPALEAAECLHENKHYGIWFKEAGVVPQGTQAADHTSLLRYIEKQKNSEIYLVHRLDRETAGIMIFAYTSEAAAHLGELFQKNLIKKEYEAIVLGKLNPGAKGTIDAALDDKAAITHYEVVESKDSQSLLKILIDTGRLHQIRRHLDHIGHPVIGDPKYGRGNKNRQGMKLVAKSLSFKDPWSGLPVNFKASAGLKL